MNQIRGGDLSPNACSRHAEVDALMNLGAYSGYRKKGPHKNRRKKRLETVDMVVGRFGTSGCYQNSGPCFHCIKFMSGKIKGYRIRHVYFTCGHGDVRKVHLDELDMNCGDYYSQGHRKPQ